MDNTRANAIGKIKEKFTDISYCLNERSRRIWAATEAKSYGWGGISVVAEATGIDPKTIRKGVSELEDPNRLAQEGIRRDGGGRKKLKDKHPQLVEDLEGLVEPSTGGDPESPLLWTCKSTYKLTDELKQQGYGISQRTICNMKKGLRLQRRK